MAISAFGVDHGPISKDLSTDGLTTAQKVRQKITGNQQPVLEPRIPPAQVSRARLKGTLTALSQEGQA